MTFSFKTAGFELQPIRSPSWQLYILYADEFCFVFELLFFNNFIANN